MIRGVNKNKEYNLSYFLLSFYLDFRRINWNVDENIRILCNDKYIIIGQVIIFVTFIRMYVSHNGNQLYYYIYSL